ncbi:MAG: winged helix-turn-helix transcriptional regulator [Alphaproteobacteria bacterium]|nr:winged helix-turn-helix transcriptional regulator [Alphaproteobacteria bacterium]
MNNLDVTFSALSDSTRRSILAQLRGGEMSLSELAEPFDMTQSAVSKHVRVLTDAGLATMEKRGRTRHCSLNPVAMKEAVQWLDEYRDMWMGSFENLGDYFAGIQNQNEETD